MGFDSTFFVKFLTKEKKVSKYIFTFELLYLLFKLLPIGRHNDFRLNYFRNGGILTKEFLIKIVKSKVEYAPYLPDNIKLESLSKDFLFSVSIILTSQLIAHIDPKTYGMMYDMYKQRTMQNVYKKWEDYSINIKEDMAEAIEQYMPMKK